MRRWLLDNSERVIETIVSETGKAYEDAQLVELGYTVSALSFWARRAPRYLGERRFLARTPLVVRRSSALTPTSISRAFSTNPFSSASSVTFRKSKVPRK